MTAALPIRSLNHVGRLTKHLNESIAFYRDVLGFQEIVRPNFDFACAWLFNYGLQIHLIVNESIPDAEGPIQSATGTWRSKSRTLPRSSAASKNSAFPFARTPWQNGRMQIFFRDPDGHHIEVGQYRRRSSQNNDQKRRSRQDVEPARWLHDRRILARKRQRGIYEVCNSMRPSLALRANVSVHFRGAASRPFAIRH